MPTKPFEMRCSFCGRLHTDVAKLIAGPGIYICDGCVNLCVDILAETTHAEPPSLPEWATLSDNELLRRIPFHRSVGGQHRRRTSRSRSRTARPRRVMGKNRRGIGHDAPVGVGAVRPSDYLTISVPCMEE